MNGLDLHLNLLGSQVKSSQVKSSSGATHCRSEHHPDPYFSSLHPTVATRLNLGVAQIGSYSGHVITTVVWIVMTMMGHTVSVIGLRPSLRGQLRSGP